MSVTTATTHGTPAHVTAAATAAVPPAAQSTTPGTGYTQNSTMASASTKAADKSWCGISAALNSCLDSIRKCLAKLPLIGSWFKPSPTPAPNPTPGPCPVEVPTVISAHDKPIVDMIHQALPYINPSLVPQLPPTPADGHLRALATMFGCIQNPIVKLELFLSVLDASNDCNGEVAEALFAELEECMQTEIMHQVYVKNGSDYYNGADHNHEIGEYVVENDIRSDLMKRAVAGAIDARKAAIAAATT